MTGFGRCETTEGNRRFTVEIKSVNHRYLDLNIKMPKALNLFENAIRSLLKEYVERGKVDIYILFEDSSEDKYTLKYNEGLAALYLTHLKEMAEKFLDMGFYLGIGGVVTFSNAKKLREVVEYMPMEQMVIETDCPYLAPVPNRGKRNDSFNLPYVVNKIAEIKGIRPDEVIDITSANAKKLYGIGQNQI